MFKQWYFSDFMHAKCSNLLLKRRPHLHGVEWALSLPPLLQDLCSVLVLSTSHHCTVAMGCHRIYLHRLCLPWHPQSHQFDSAPVQTNIPRIPRSYQLSSPPFRAVAWAVPLLAHWKSPAAVCTGKTGIGRIALTWLVGVHSFTISETADGLLIQPRLSFFQHADLFWVICSAMDSLAGDLGAMAPLANWIKLKREYGTHGTTCKIGEFTSFTSTCWFPHFTLMFSCSVHSISWSKLLFGSQASASWSKLRSSRPRRFFLIGFSGGKQKVKNFTIWRYLTIQPTTADPTALH